MSSPDYEFDAQQLSRFIFIDTPEAGAIRVMCNYCVGTKIFFYAGEATDITGSDWLVKAAIHAVDAHKGMR